MIKQIIFLNGPSSSGKSTLAKTLQNNLMPAPYITIGIDKIIGMMPQSINNWDGGQAEQGFWWQESVDTNGHTIQTLQVGPYAQKVNNTFKDIVVTMANHDLSIIIDEICLSSESWQTWQQKLAPFKTLYVGVICPTEILEQREKKRGDRIIGSARAQNNLVHLNKSYDLKVDTNKNSIPECAKQIIMANKN